MSELELSKELKDSIREFLDLLEENGWELNDDGDIVEKGNQRLVLDTLRGKYE